MTLPALSLALPWPPSANAMWKPRAGGGVRLSEEARRWKARARTEVRAQCLGGLGTDRVAVVLTLCPPPGARSHDIDNRAKLTLDALQSGGAIADDSQIDVLTVTRGAPAAGGAVLVEIRKLEA